MQSRHPGPWVCDVRPGEVSPGDVPTCGTGPAARWRFARRELADLWREWRARRAVEPPVDGEEER
jgi:hypothetical protein